MKLTFKPIHFLLSALIVSSKYAAGSSSYPVTDASQSLCYDTVTTQAIDCSLARPGQDAFYDNMVAQEYCDNQDDTVTDMKTGLMRTKKLYGKMPISQALQPFSLAGHNDWRPPTMVRPRHRERERERYPSVISFFGINYVIVLLTNAVVFLLSERTVHTHQF